MILALAQGSVLFFFFFFRPRLRRTNIPDAFLMPFHISYMLLSVALRSMRLPFDASRSLAIVAASSIGAIAIKKLRLYMLDA